jgi:hypothetical protein
VDVGFTPPGDEQTAVDDKQVLDVVRATPFVSLELDRRQRLNRRATILRSEKVHAGGEPWSGLENTAIAYRRRWRECRSVDSIPRPSAVPRRPATVGLGRRREPTTGIAAATGRLNKIFRPQNRGAVIQTLPAISSSEDDPRSLRFSNGF